VLIATWDERRALAERTISSLMRFGGYALTE